MGTCIPREILEMGMACTLFFKTLTEKLLEKINILLIDVYWMLRLLDNVGTFVLKALFLRYWHYMMLK